ncbi:hypothetical protein HanIR_Chr01g0010821 [Helianthus annuus]|nr:hypothetical protein HanIR_Chr01g0010821 [Helianthus annuus]
MMNMTIKRRSCLPYPDSAHCTCFLVVYQIGCVGCGLWLNQVMYGGRKMTVNRG